MMSFATQWRKEGRFRLNRLSFQGRKYAPEGCQPLKPSTEARPLDDESLIQSFNWLLRIVFRSSADDHGEELLSMIRRPMKWMEVALIQYIEKSVCRGTIVGEKERRCSKIAQTGDMLFDAVTNSKQASKASSWGHGRDLMIFVNMTVQFNALHLRCLFTLLTFDE
jgi:hypothetical protein